ncbi:phosphotransferase [Paenibacillus rigui]|uniref:Aminoglycoside phosphotransferase domain-containing protein n=1 Tax=Paenibacillus rigui TaxID=554312 RepID=A0A229UU27_9BACL|nr:phosphotransferase [Paenibacillus rigui]OXM86912.1 hypothetical protein CF651_08690 [Paenibacillus rigui]
MVKGPWDRLVQKDGQLDDGQLISRNILYIGRNGKKVERFIAKGLDGSYIFKPLTNEDTMGREIWIYRNVLPLLKVRYPRLLAYAEHQDPKRFWAIYEDLGELTHNWDWGTLLHAAQAIPLWHELPLEQVPASFEGHSPGWKEVRRQVTEVTPGWSLAETLGRLQWTEQQIRQAMTLLDSPLPDGLEMAMVISHGDFHPMNLSLLAGGELVIMDWEYVHRNSVFWDLYNLLDITSPRYTKPVVEPSLRKEVLLAYVRRRASLGTSINAESFMTAYYHYALLHSLWILLLVEKDLKNCTADEVPALREQQQITQHISRDLMNELA